MARLKIGGFIKCIDNKNYEKELTVGKIYEIQDFGPDAVYIINDTKADFGYNKGRFKILSLNEVAIFKQFETIKE